LSTELAACCAHFGIKLVNFPVLSAMTGISLAETGSITTASTTTESKASKPSFTSFVGLSARARGVAEFAKDVLAFHNTEGGIIAVGISDRLGVAEVVPLSLAVYKTQERYGAILIAVPAQNSIRDIRSKKSYRFRPKRGLKQGRNLDSLYLRASSLFFE
jgi:hypothetical protein